MKNYEKPFVELVSFQAEEKIMTVRSNIESRDAVLYSTTNLSGTGGIGNIPDDLT